MSESRKIRLVSLFLVLALVFSLSGCGSAESVQQKFDEFTDEFFRNEVSSDILTLHTFLAHPENYGIDDYEISLGHYSDDDEAESYKLLKEYQKKLNGFKYDSLTADQQLTYDILSTFLSDLSNMEGYRLYSDCLSPINGMQSYVPTILAEYTFYDKGDVEDYLEILRQFPAFFEELISFSRKQSEAGFFMQDFETDKVIDQCREFMADPENHYLIASFDERVDAADFLSDDERSELKAQDKELIVNTVVPAYQYLIDELTKLKGTCKNEGGLANFENGAAYYELLVRQVTGSDKTVPEIKELIEGNFDAYMEEFITLFSENPEILNTMFDYTLPSNNYPEILNTLKADSETDFPSMPDRPFTVNFVPASMEKYANPAYYILPPIDNLDDNSIYINSAYMTDSIDDFVTLAHEGFPGHLYQTTYFYSTNPANIRKLLNTSGYVEGWGMYAEMYSYSLAGLDESVQRANELNKAYSFAIYCLTDIGVNYEGWTYDETMNFLSGIGLSEEDSQEIYEAMVAEPAIYLAYYLGYLEFIELRDQAEAALGDKFSLKDFHEFLLKTGPAQFEIVEKYMQRWIETQK